jgi:hypothetical protein
VRSRDRYTVGLRAVRDLLQPRGRRARRRRPGPDARPARRIDQGLRQAHHHQAGRAARRHLDQAPPEPVPAGHPGGLLRTDAAAIKAEENLDGKYLLRSSDPKLPAEDIALGCKQLLEAERGWRDLKQVIDLRPVYHRKEERIRAHVTLCWLALPLVRIDETANGLTWAKIADELDLLTWAPSPARRHLPADRRAHQKPNVTCSPSSRSRPRRRSSRPPTQPLTSGNTIT